MGWPKGVKRSTKLESAIKAVAEAPQPLTDSRVNQVVRPVPVEAPIPEVETVVRNHANKSLTNGEVQQLIMDRLHIVIQIMKRTKQCDWMLGGLQATESDIKRLIEGRKNTMFGRSA
jgi:hypothetical protein